MFDYEIDVYRNLIQEDLEFDLVAPYSPDPNTPIHRWYLIPESTSLEWAQRLMHETAVSDYAFVMDPFCGSGTVALQCMCNNANFIGGEWLADAIVGTLAKIMSDQLTYGEFRHYAKVLLDLAEQRCYVTRPTARTEPSLPGNLLELVTEAQNFVLASQASLPCQYGILSAIYKSFRKTTSLGGAGLEQWKRRFATALRHITEDLEGPRPKPRSMRWALHYGDSTQADWCSMLADIGIGPSKEKGLLLTSPTFVQSSQDRGEQARFCNSLAANALADAYKLHRHTKENSVDLTAAEVNGIIKHMPPAVQGHLRTLVSVLTSFRQLAEKSSLAIIESENPQFGEEVIEVDLYICLLAELLHFSPVRIRVIHYIVNPGTIDYTSSNKRGSLIYLKIDAP